MNVMALASANSRDNARQNKVAQRQADAKCDPMDMLHHQKESPSKMLKMNVAAKQNSHAYQEQDGTGNDTTRPGRRILTQVAHRSLLTSRR